ncbi:hypothetical protein [Rhizobium skierniewicense]|uniref:hypothetical protein n=1 Tax=Rhizobium skierniewicense TaxID=984260 RepID=UPI001572795B|nr:hypothetical protein [Rhizobium skierniewicense]NTF34213.1 hypothetical protein [Rhizobium skierniewicense]
MIDVSAGKILPTPVKVMSSDAPSELLRFTVTAYRKGLIALPHPLTSEGDGFPLLDNPAFLH